MADLNAAKKLINEFMYKEYGEVSADYSDLTNVGLAYTTTEDGHFDIEASVDLLRYSISLIIDGTPVKITRYENIEALIEKELQYLDFEELVFVSDAELQKITLPEIQPKKVTGSPEPEKSNEPERNR